MGETINLAVLQEHWAVNVDQARGPSTVSTHNWIGRLTPLHCTSSGKVLLAHLTAEHRAALLLAASGMPRLTARTVPLAPELEAQIAAVREHGFATAVEAVAAPVRDRSGDVVASLSVSGPSYRLDEERMAALVEPLRNGAAEISTRMGWYTA